MQRTLLGHLLLAAGRSVLVDELADHLWPVAGPARPRSALQLLVLRLRRTLKAFGCAGRIDSTPRAYRFELAGDLLDAIRFEELVRSAEREREGGDVEAERALLEAALELWRGPVFGDPSADVRGIPEVHHLVRLRLTAVERLADAETTCGRPERAVSLVRRFLAEDPARERFRYLLIRALHRSGHRSEALAAYQETYRYMADELGLEPGAALRGLQESILRDEDVRDGRGHPGPDVLPTRVAGFVGRTALIRGIGAQVLADTRAGTAICGVTGMPGVGKSALALHVAHRLRPHFPDGNLYGELDEGRDAAQPVAEVLATFLRLLGVADHAVPACPHARTGLFRSLTSGKRLLVVVDGATRASQVQALLPGDGGSAVLVTSRRALADVDGSRWFEVPDLDHDESARVLGACAGEPRVAAEPAAARRIIAYCDTLPLALRIVGARLAARPDWSLARMAGALADHRNRLARLTLGDLSVAEAIAGSYRQCTAEQRAVLTRLAAVEDTSFTPAAVAGLLHTDPAGAAEVVEQLVDARMVRAAGDADRYRLPDLVRLFVLDQARRCGRPDPHRGGR